MPRKPSTVHRKNVSTRVETRLRRRPRRPRVAEHDVGLLPELGGRDVRAEELVFEGPLLPVVGPGRLAMDDEQLIDPAGQGVPGAQEDAVASVVGEPAPFGLAADQRDQLFGARPRCRATRPDRVGP